MDVNVTTTEIEQQEIDGIDGIVHSLWEKKLLTDFDCRIIAASINTLLGTKAAVYTVIMSKSKDEAAILTESFRNITVTVHAKEQLLKGFDNDANSNNEENSDTLSMPKNPFLINPIITHLFGFLSLENMKRSRLVCREWNSAAEICLRKRSAVHFRRNVLPPQTFMKVSKYSLPDHPFSSFVFSNFEKNDKLQISKIEDFFEKYGKNIKELKFNPVALTFKCNLTVREVLIPYYDLNSLLINPSNVTSLIIRSYDYRTEKTIFDIALEKFVSIKTLSLKDCRIIVSAENRITRIAPLSVHFNSVSIIQNRKTVTHLRCNDLVDFSKTLNISLCNQYSMVTRDPIFDMGKEVFNVKQLHLTHVLDNWSLAKGDVEFLYLCNNNYFVESNQLKIKQLQAKDSRIDISALPETLEILKCADGTIFCSEDFYLPNLKYLFIPGRSIDTLVYLSNCPLVELEITSATSTFNLHLVPKSVKKLKMQLTDISDIKFTDNSILELDTFILKGWFDHSGLKHSKGITAQIKAKVLVVEYESELDLVVPLVLNNVQSEEIIIGLSSVLFRKIHFERSVLSKYVDKKSNYYQFENNFGKSITKAHFEGFTKMNYYCTTDFFNYGL